METVEEMIKVMQSFTEGKKIEVKRRHGNNDWWEETRTPHWDWVTFDYRVKKE